MKISSEVAKALVWEDYSDEYEVVDDGHWEAEHKYEYKSLIFKYKDKFYELSVSRSGSYYTEYYYDWEVVDEFECPEMEQVTITQEIWRKKSEASD